MADARDSACWTQHAIDCRNQGRKPFVFNKDDWFWQKAQWLKQQGCKTILDFGCGPGYWSSLWKGFDYTGFDQNNEMIALAKEVSPKLNFTSGLLLHFRENSFDIVFSAGVLQHNKNNPDKIDCLKVIRNVLKDGGFYYFTENTLTPETDRNCANNINYTDGYSFTSHGWIIFLETNGFKLIEHSARDKYIFRKI